MKAMAARATPAADVHHDQRGNATSRHAVAAGTVDLYWIPLGAGAHIVRINGLIYETFLATLQHRKRQALYHTVLGITLPHGRYMVEMTPVPDADGASRGVVAEGPVGLRSAGRFRWFRYEVRRWRNGIVPDLGYAVRPPIRIGAHGEQAQAVFDRLPAVPTLVWGRDEARTDDMWSCNSIIAWTLAKAGVDVAGIPLPAGGRAPGWDAGLVLANRP